ncbi:glycerophosphodiester phosphodiesterase [Prevotella salivae]|uniref:Glycerophosphodiester phosphodiesterase n=1 Tax=Segatella salivae TaxID=228604 RepID=A0AAW4NQX1_9BACT|nr:glycerophosphodiester phosphodiesterase family protein [Segatella salivae]MBW4865857.1 glycerophosphodiester phosphodiesterase [Segatella salivae]MBW4910374.1 glycerophosphodiester phosphodiesterase [Segatella salivae]
MKTLYRLGLLGLAAVSVLSSCSDEQEFTNENTDAKRIAVQQISPEMAKVRDYVPLYACMAHRGSTYWAPEETEAAWRWARNMGADYLESDLQVTKDGVVLANHDENLKRTTNIEDVFSDEVPTVRKDFYRSFRNADGSQHFTEADIEAQYDRDKKDFRSNYTLSYYYAELLMLDAGKWFNDATPEQERASFAARHNGKVVYSASGAPSIQYSDGLYVSALQDQINYAMGKMLNRDANGRRVLTYKIKPEYQNMTLAEIYKAAKAAVKVDEPSVVGNKAAKYMDFVEYSFGDKNGSTAYVNDPADNGNRPGIYPEFKESWLNPKDIEIRVYNILDEWGWNIITKPESASSPFYKNGKVNVGNTNGKVVLQTFSFDALHRAYGVFKGKVPMCYLLWITKPTPYATDIAFDTPSGYASIIKYAQDNGAHIIGPSIAGAPNNYPEMNKPWQAYMIRKAGMLNHPYSFDSDAQMKRNMGYYVNFWGQNPTEFDDVLNVTVQPTAYTTFKEPDTHPVYMDGYFTNRSEISLHYMIENGFRCNAKLANPFHPGQLYDNSQAPSKVPNADTVLDALGY